jgi:polysaccharide biosynthesis/export protein
MPNPYLRWKDPSSGGRSARRISAAMLLMVCGVFLIGCAGSSGSSVALTTATVGSDASGAMTTANSAAGGDATAFAPTAASAGSANAAAVQAADKLTSVAKAGNSAYKIGPLDVLDISVFKVPDLNKSVQVAEDGSVNYPLIGDIAAAGKTAHELERDLTQKLGGKYLRSPQVTVFVKEYNSQRVTVTGSSKSTGVYPIKGNTTLLQVLAMAGDVNPDIASGDIVVFRTIDGQRTAAKFDINAIKSGQSEDPLMQPGDVVVVDTSATKVALSNILKVMPLATTAAVFSGL